MENQIKKYLNDPKDESIRKDIEKGNKKQSYLKSEGEKLKVNLTYLNKICYEMINEYHLINIYSFMVNRFRNFFIDNLDNLNRPQNLTTFIVDSLDFT
jgi:hypothetical protein